jgi:hypothetical protein
MGILRKMFGPSREEVWSRLAEQIGARYEDRGFWKGGGRVVADVGEWTVTMDVYTETSGDPDSQMHHAYTRLRAPYVNPDGFRFSVRRKHLFDGIGKLLRRQDVEIGHRAFDEAFVVKATDEGKVRRLLRNKVLREMLEDLPDVHLEVRDDEGWFGPRFPDGVDELHLLVSGVVTDADLLEGYFDLFAETLHGLCHVGAAYEDDPGLDL